MTSNTDRIEKQILLRAPLESVWRAISDAREFGSWFGMRLDGPFVAGSRLGGEIVPTTVDPDIAASQKPYEGQRFDIMVDRVEPMRLPSRTPITRRTRLPSSSSSWRRSGTVRC